MWPVPKDYSPSLLLQLRFPWLVAVLLFALFPPTYTDRLDEAVRYLETYQYIGPTAVDPSMQVRPAEIREGHKLTEAIREFQRVARLPQTGVVDDATLRMMRKPRCGVSDVTGPPGNPRRSKRYALLGSKWKKTRVTYKILRYSPQILELDVEHYLQQAFEVWMSVTPLKFEQVFHGTADIEIDFGAYNHGDPYPFDGRGNTLAHAFTPGEGLAGDVHFDESERWVLRDPTGGSDLFTVAVHEIGHALGLSHSYSTGSIMRPFYDYVENPDNVLTNDDIAGVQYLYGPGGQKPVTPRPTHRPVPTAIPRSSTTEFNPPPPPTTPTLPRGPLPAYCKRQVHFDAILSTQSGYTYAFEGWQYVYVWKGSDLEPSTPKLTSDVFQDLHWGVDTAFSIKDGSTETIYILKLWFVWTYDAKTLKPLRAQVPLQKIFPDLPNYIDAAFRYHHDGFVYAFKGGEYWRLRRVKKDLFKADPGFPRPSSDWNLPGNSLNAAMSWAMNGRTYFFNGAQYYKYNDQSRKVEHGYPRNVNVWWLGCPDVPKGLNLGEVPNAREGSGSVTIATTITWRLTLLMVTMTTVLLS